MQEYKVDVDINNDQETEMMVRTLLHQGYSVTITPIKMECHQPEAPMEVGIIHMDEPSMRELFDYQRKISDEINRRSEELQRLHKRREILCEARQDTPVDLPTLPTSMGWSDSRQDSRQLDPRPPR